MNIQGSKRHEKVIPAKPDLISFPANQIATFYFLLEFSILLKSFVGVNKIRLWCSYFSNSMKYFNSKYHLTFKNYIMLLKYEYSKCNK